MLSKMHNQESFDSEITRGQIMNRLAKMFEPSKDRLINNARTMMQTAHDPWFKSYWEKVYKHLLKEYGRLN